MELPADATVTLRTPTCVQIQSGDQVDLDRCWDVNEDRYVFTAMGVLSGHEGELGYVVFSTSPGYRLHEVEFRDRPSWNEVASSDYTAVIVYHLSSGRLQRYAFEGGDDVVECDVVGPVPSCRSQMVAP